LQYIFLGYVFSLFQEVISGYMRGYGVSLIPAVCTIAGICGTRVIWIYTVFRANPTFTVIMQVYPVSLAITALIIAVSALIYKKKNPQIDIESA
jgi:Na+-driven multidrug efflux pump